MVAEVIIQKEPKRVTKRYTLEEYFELEEKAFYKNNFVNGKIIAVISENINHNILSGTINALLLTNFFNSQKIGVFNSYHKIYISKFHTIIFADTFITTEKIQPYKNSNQAVINPTLIFEVASESTEKFDRTDKFRMYQSLPSFKEYVIVSQTMPIVEVYYKIEENKWQMTSYTGLDKVVKFDTLDVALKMSDIYKKITNLKDPHTYIEFPVED
jgi:Uma2 family endonuclease